MDPALERASLDEIRRRGADARRLGLPFHSNPFYASREIDLGKWFSRFSAWSEGWAEEDAGRDPPPQERMRLRLW